MFQISLKQLREDRGLSQSQLAKELGVSQSTVGNWESGAREPNFSTTQQIADFFNVSVDYLLGNTDEPRTLDQQLEGIDFALFGEVHELTDEEKQDVINFAKFIKSQRKNAENND